MKTLHGVRRQAGYSLYILTLLACLTLSMPALADHDDDLHFAAHFGTAYAVDSVVQGLSEKALKMSPLQSETFAAFTTVFIGLAYKAQENSSGADMLKATWQNAVGIGASVLTRCAFHWEF